MKWKTLNEDVSAEERCRKVETHSENPRGLNVSHLVPVEFDDARCVLVLCLLDCAGCFLEESLSAWQLGRKAGQNLPHRREATFCGHQLLFQLTDTPQHWKHNQKTPAKTLHPGQNGYLCSMFHSQLTNEVMLCWFHTCTGILNISRHYPGELQERMQMSNAMKVGTVVNITCQTFYLCIMSLWPQCCTWTAST